MVASVIRSECEFPLDVTAADKEDPGWKDIRDLKQSARVLCPTHGGTQYPIILRKSKTPGLGDEAVAGVEIEADRPVGEYVGLRMSWCGEQVH